MKREKSELLEDILTKLEKIHADLLEERKENFGKQAMSSKKEMLRKQGLETVQRSCHSCLEEQETKDCPDLW